MGRVFPYPGDEPKKINTQIKTTVITSGAGFAKDAENIRRDWKRVLGAVSQKIP
jgi:hypothetical protein